METGAISFQARVVRTLNDHGLLRAEFDSANPPADVVLNVVEQLASYARDAREAVSAAGIDVAGGYPRTLFGGDNWRLVWAADGTWTAVPSKDICHALVGFVRFSAGVSR